MLESLFVALMFAVGSAAFAQQDIEKIDKNFRQATVGARPVEYHNAFEEPFVLTGFPFRKSGEPIHRVPLEFTKEDVNNGVLGLSHHTSGGAVLFRTNSPYLALDSTPRTGAAMGHMPSTGVSGYDLYRRDTNGKQSFVCNVRTRGPNGSSMGGSARLQDYILYLPLYSGMTKLEIGVKPGSKFEKPTPQKISLPILFYGSSITQGGCASRPANNYTTMLCRTLDAPQVNLGFSGAARGETAMAKAIASVKMSAFVYDYDYNAPSAEHLLKTHEPFFKIIRAAQPALPIIILSRCSNYTESRRNAVKKTYDNAIAAGDKNVYFIDGSTLFGEAGRDNSTVDGCHPNDLGFYMMYQNVLPVLKKALKL